MSESVSRVVMGSWFLATLFGLMSWRLVLRQILRYMRSKGYNSRTAAIIGMSDSGIRLRDQMVNHPDIGIRFKGFYDDAEGAGDAEGVGSIEGSIDDVIARANAGEFDLIFIALPLSDQNRISQILKNLVSNSLKFTHDGNITLEVNKTSDKKRPVQIIVSDTGIGIPKEKQQLIKNQISTVSAMINAILDKQPDINKAKELLNWEPSVQLEEGLANTIAYFKNTYM